MKAKKGGAHWREQTRMASSRRAAWARSSSSSRVAELADEGLCGVGLVLLTDAAQHQHPCVEKVSPCSRDA